MKKMVFAITLAAWMTLTTAGASAMGGEEYWPRYGPFILDLPMIAEPGPQFGCNSGGSHLLSALVTLRIGEIAEVCLAESLRLAGEPALLLALRYPGEHPRMG